MTTLGALLVGLLLLLLLLGVFAWMQRRPRRGPEQPRTVADLVRMREAVRPDADDDRGRGLGGAEAPEREPEPVEAPQAPVAAAEVVESPVGLRDARRRAIRRAGGAAPLAAGGRPEDAAVEMPWARAARMVEPGAGVERIRRAATGGRRSTG